MSEGTKRKKEKLNHVVHGYVGINGNVSTCDSVKKGGHRMITNSDLGFLLMNFIVIEIFSWTICSEKLTLKEKIFLPFIAVIVIFGLGVSFKLMGIN